MEEFKKLNDLMEMDEKHKLMGSISGSVPNLKSMHNYLSQETINEEAPDEIKGQFSVAKNMALYSYFFYALAPEVHLKTYTLIEHALRIKTNSNKKMMLNKLINHALEQHWIKDEGFRHIETPYHDNDWCKSLPKVISKLRNSKAHGSSMLAGDCLDHISVCADFINQLFPCNNNHKT